MQNRKVWGYLGLAARAGKAVSGSFCVERSVRRRRAKLVIVSQDASENTKKAFRDLCTYYKVPLYIFGSSDELGKLLMKSFLFAVGQLPQLPKTMLFYNGGAKLTVKGSASLEDLKSLEAQGVEILTCGTCLNFYGLADQLAVGGVTNMYSIVETLANAGKVIKP